MATPSSGQISATNISDEFGRNLAGNQMSLGGYRLSQTVGSLSFNGIDSGVPSSGEIKFSDFYNKRLNVVVDFHSGGQESRQNAKNRYNNNSVTVIGGFRGRKEAGSKILIHVNKIIGSAKGNQANVALRTGTWNSDVVLSVDVGSSGRLYGAGGDGGQGADSWSDGGSTNGGSGGNGTSALGIEHEETAVNVQSGGKINAGAPGGGGGAGARQVDSGADRSACGGGGGGGAGLPAGSGGRGGVRQSGNPDEVQNGNGGSAGQLEENGEGGSGGNNANEAIGANGGRGGDFNEGGGELAQGGNGGRNLDSSNGSAGNNGSAIRRSSGSIQVDITNGGAIHGGTNDIGIA
jgi:hypothetical protein